jgi:hypothetical protein
MLHGEGCTGSVSDVMTVIRMSFMISACYITGIQMVHCIKHMNAIAKFC